MKRLVLFGALGLLTGCTTLFQKSAVEIDAPVTPVRTETGNAVVSSDIEKYRELGKFYRLKYASDLVNSAVIDLKKIQTSRQIVKRLTDSGTLQIQRLEIDPKIAFEKHSKSSVVDVKLLPSKISISKPQVFYDSVISSKELMHFNGITKAGTWWAYIDSSKLLTWESYFWMAYFIDNGYTAEYSKDLNMTIVGSFSTFEEANYLKAKHPEAPISTAYVVLNTNPYAEDESVPTLKPNAIPNVSGLKLEKIQ